MSLPKINAPVYQVELPISKKKIKFRPFTVKEQKILLMAVENDESVFTVDNIKQLITNCCLSDIDVDKLSIIDVEFFFVNLRARSVGEIIETNYRCDNELDDGTYCHNRMKVEYNLLDINVNDPEIVDQIQLTPTIGVKMNYPGYSVIEKLKTSKGLSELTFDFIISCMEFIYDKNDVYQISDYKKEELYEFLESLTLDQFKKIEDYFTRIPKLQKKLDIKCDKCGFEHKITIEGLENFFG
jgi:hypothetical protein